LSKGIFDLRDALPGIGGFAVHVVPPAQRPALAAALEEGGFRTSILDGSAVRDEASFFREAARALRLPDYFGHNWDALDECLHDLGEGQWRRHAVLWEDAPQSLAAAAQTFLDALHVLIEAARDLGGEDPPTQLEVFVLGNFGVDRKS
jgi:RNAse (barnase) inhibitor barstar